MPQYDVFKNRWEINGTLVLETPLHIGAGQSDTKKTGITGKILTYKDGQNQVLPFIPGSSLKGVLRSTIERLLRTFSQPCCLSVVEDDEESCCGNCRVCEIFGSPESGASITVREAHLSPEWLTNHPDPRIIIAEQMHCATKYDENLRPKMNAAGNVETGAWPQERVVVGAEFRFSIMLDDAEDIHVGYILLALDEFNQKRMFLGAGTSRGLGVVSIKPFPPNVIRTIPDRRNLTFTSKPVENSEILKIINAARKSLQGDQPTIQSPVVSRDSVDFSIYSHAYDTLPLNGTPPSGCVVAELEIKTLDSFRMQGINEVTVTSGKIPYIPGSTIKGFLRHTFIASNNSGGSPAIDWIFRVFGKLAYERAGGETHEKPVHWSHLLVSDAFPCENIVSGNGQRPQEIPAGTRLRLWCVFNNMEGTDIKTIMDILTDRQGITITGKTIAENDPPRHHNKVSMTLKDPPGYKAFRADAYLNGV